MQHHSFAGVPLVQDARPRRARLRSGRAHRRVMLLRMSLPISLRDVRAAADRLAGVAHRTPVLTSRLADERAGAKLFFKCENLQRVGAFKFRGAYNALAQFTPEQRRAGVIAFSSGNHAQAIALAARLLDMPSV